MTSKLSWQKTLDSGQVLLIDGASGTELQRKGVPMDEVAWSGAAVLTHPDAVREMHEEYIRAGAKVIITNTFGSTRQMMGPAGYGDQVEKVHRDAVRLAKEARENCGDPSIAIAGSISTEPPRFDRDDFLAPDDELAAYREAAHLLADAGADLIALEMMVDEAHASRAMEAALETGLPIWLGVSCRRNDQGELVSFDFADIAFADILDRLIPMGPNVVNVMHSPIDSIHDAVAEVRKRWSGPIGVYPESGYFTKPHWNFVDVIDPEDLVDEAKRWVAAGVQLVGGCCGTNAAHIEALHAAMPSLDALRND